MPGLRARSDTAVVLFTLTPEAEAARKPLAARVFASLIEHVQSMGTSLPGVDLLVAAPDGPADLRQRGRDFGESLRFAFEDAFAIGYGRVVVIGNDAPEMTPSYLGEAVAALAGEGSRAVLGPAADGGYNLLGLTEPCQSLFTGVVWGSSDVCDLTRARLLGAGFGVALLSVLPDIDDEKALDRFVLRVIGSGRRISASIRSLARRLAGLIASRAGRASLEKHSRTKSVWTPSSFAPRRGPPLTVPKSL